MRKKNIALTETLIMTLGLLIGCSKSFAVGKKPKGLDDAMVELWEETLSDKIFDTSVLDPETTTEITIGADITDITDVLYDFKNLENIYVAEGNPIFVSNDGILYSKSYETLYKWPAKKQVTALKETIKYFAPACFSGCVMPENFELPDGAITIGAYAFANTNLTKIHIKDNVKSVGLSFFPATCKTIEISSPIVYTSFFLRFGGGLLYSPEHIIFNEGVKQIRVTNAWHPNRHRYSMMDTKTIEFPNTLEAIGDVFFPVNVRVAAYVLPASIIYLGRYAFDDYYLKPKRFAKPVRVPREVNTTFDCKGEISLKYIEKNASKWDNKNY